MSNQHPLSANQALRLPIELILDIFEHAAPTSDGRIPEFWTTIKQLCSWSHRAWFTRVFRNVAISNGAEKSNFLRLAKTAESEYGNLQLVRSMWLDTSSGCNLDDIHAGILKFCTSLSSMTIDRRTFVRLHRMTISWKDCRRVVVKIDPRERPALHITLLDGLLSLKKHLKNETGSAFLETITHLYIFPATMSAWTDLDIPVALANLTHIAITCEIQSISKLTPYLDHCLNHKPHLKCILLVVSTIMPGVYRGYAEEPAGLAAWLKPTFEWYTNRRKIDDRLAIRHARHAQSFSAGQLDSALPSAPWLNEKFAVWREWGGEWVEQDFWQGFKPVDEFWAEVFDRYDPAKFVWETDLE